MNIYFAGTPGTISRELVWQNKCKRRLLSYFEFSQPQHLVKEAFNLIKNEYIRSRSVRGPKSNRN